MSNQTEIQKTAARKMRRTERTYGKAFLQKSLHQVRFEYQALSRVARGLDTTLPSTERQTQAE